MNKLYFVIFYIFMMAGSIALKDDMFFSSRIYSPNSNDDSMSVINGKGPSISDNARPLDILLYWNTANAYLFTAQAHAGLSFYTQHIKTVFKKMASHLFLPEFYRLRLRSCSD